MPVEREGVGVAQATIKNEKNERAREVVGSVPACAWALCAAPCVFGCASEGEKEEAARMRDGKFRRFAFRAQTANSAFRARIRRAFTSPPPVLFTDEYGLYIRYRRLFLAVSLSLSLSLSHTHTHTHTHAHTQSEGEGEGEGEGERERERESR
jgi:hypothetical protein